MTITIHHSQDLNLETIKQVAWKGKSVTLSDFLLKKLDSQRSKFLHYVEENSNQHLYGITTAHHIGAKRLLTKEEREDFSKRLPPTPPGVGKPLPERVVRAIIIARLADFIGGTAPVQPNTSKRMIGMLDEPLPVVPSQGLGEPGDIIPLGILFKDLPDKTQLGLGEGMFLINGSPVASAVLADVVLAGQSRIKLMENVFALAAAAFGASDQHYDAALDSLWGDPYQARVLERFRTRLDQRSTTHQRYQAPVSFRSAPRMLGWAHRVQEQAEECAQIALRSPSNNPVFVEDTTDGSYKVISNGGYHNPFTAGTIDNVTRSWADLAQLAMHQVNRITEKQDGILKYETEPRLTVLYMAASGWAEEARNAASASLISMGPGGQTDTSTPDVLAWNKAQLAGEALDHVVSLLGILAAHTLAYQKQTPPPALHELYQKILLLYPRKTDYKDFSKDLRQVIHYLTNEADSIDVAVSNEPL